MDNNNGQIQIDWSQLTPQQKLVGRKTLRGVARVVAIIMLFNGIIFSAVSIPFLFTECTDSSYYSSSTTYINGEQVTNIECDGTVHETKQLNTAMLPFLIIGIAAVIGAVVILVIAHRHRKKDDLDGDGVENDLQPATDEQMRLIENGMRELGQFYTPPNKRPNQMYARQILKQIKEHIEQNKRRTN